MSESPWRKKSKFSAKPSKEDPIICRCNEIRKSQIESAILNGAKTLNEIFDHTLAGVGACGGTCRGKLQYILDTYQKTGEFPQNIKDPKTGL